MSTPPPGNRWRPPPQAQAARLAGGDWRMSDSVSVQRWSTFRGGPSHPELPRPRRAGRRRLRCCELHDATPFPAAGQVGDSSSMRDVDEVKALEPVCQLPVARFPKPTRALQAADHGTLELESVVEVLSAQYAVATGRKRLVRRTRLDTFDHRLGAAGLTLEHQIGGSGGGLGIRRPGGSPPVGGG